MNIESGIIDYIYEQKIMPELPNYMGHIFEDISIQFLKKLNKNMTLPFIFDDIGRWWGNNPIGKCQEEIDIIAISKNSAIFGECKWKNSVGVEVLENLKRKADLFKQFQKKYYCLFAKGTFTKALQDIAKQDDSVKLITLKDIYNN